MRVRKNPAERKQEIINAAMTVFYQKGYTNTSISDIANSMNVTHGLIYNYFTSKEELYQTAVNQFIDELVTEYLEVFKKSGTNIIETFEATSKVLSKRRDTPFYKFYRKVGNEYIYQQVMMQLFAKLIPKLTTIISTLLQDSEYQIKDVQTFLEFIMYGQIEIFRNPAGAEAKKEHIKNYITVLLESSKHQEI